MVNIHLQSCLHQSRSRPYLWQTRRLSASCWRASLVAFTIVESTLIMLCLTILEFGLRIGYIYDHLKIILLFLQGSYWFFIFSSSIFQWFNTVGWGTQKASACRKTECQLIICWQWLSSLAASKSGMVSHSDTRLSRLSWY